MALQTGGITSRCPPNSRITFQARNFKIRIPPRPMRMQIRETNPIPPRPTANRQKPKAASTKRTQFPHTKCPAAPQSCKTNPIPRTPAILPTLPPPNCAKRTQCPTLRKLLYYRQCRAVAGGVPELEEFVVHSGYYHLEAAHFLYGQELADEGSG